MGFRFVVFSRSLPQKIALDMLQTPDESEKISYLRKSPGLKEPRSPSCSKLLLRKSGATSALPLDTIDSLRKTVYGCLRGLPPITIAYFLL